MLDCILNGKTVYAWKVHDREADYKCPMCNNPVRLKRGNKKIPHFAHISSNDCSYGEGVSEDHLVVQKEITEILSSNNIQCKLEYRGIKNRRADVFVEYLNNKIVFEIQHSRIEPQEILARTQDYNNNGCSVIWVMTPTYFAKFAGLYGTQKIRLSSWQAYILTLFGVIYVWNNNKLYAFDFETAWGSQRVYEYGEYIGDEDVQLKESYDKKGIAEIDLMFGLREATLKEFKSEIRPHVKLWGLDPEDGFPADWKFPRKDLDWDDPLR